jgi:xanthine dehydrogenase accessory factor
MYDLLPELLARTDRGETVAICVVVRTHGSTPQKAGATMLVLSDGKTRGTLGGGCVEAEVRTRCMKLMSERQPKLMSFKLDNDYGWDDGLVCGGSMLIAVTFPQSPEALAPWRAAQRSIQLRKKTSVQISVPDETGAMHTFVHPIGAKPQLIIAGAGHVSAALAHVMTGLDFDITVIDDRPDFANTDRFPGIQCLVGDIEQLLRKQKIDEQTFTVILTRGHRHDAASLACVVESAARYIGLIGSRRKVLTILRDLHATGVSFEKLSRVHAPIGLAIGAITPAEIAVSIAAELVAVHRNNIGPIAYMKFDTDRLRTLLHTNEPAAPD